MLFLFPKEQPDEVIGQVSYTSIVRGPADMCMLGYALAERAQGNGYMHEALQATNAYVFKELNMHRVMANFMPHNTQQCGPRGGVEAPGQVVPRRAQQRRVVA